MRRCIPVVALVLGIGGCHLTVPFDRGHVVTVPLDPPPDHFVSCDEHPAPYEGDIPCGFVDGIPGP